MKYRGMKYTTGLITAGAAGIILSAAATAKGDMKSFSELDQNSDQIIVAAELEPVASKHQKQADELLNTYDQNQDNGLDQQEFRRAQNELSSSQDRTAQISDAKEREGSKIIVDEQPAQVTVNQPPAKVTIKQGAPEVTVATDDPEVTVHQAEPEVSVDKPKPEVSIQQAEPEVVINEAEPNVNVEESEPRVNVQSGEPEVTVLERDQEHQQQASQSQQQTQRQASQAEDVYAMSIADIRDARIVDPEGNVVGGVEEVVIKNDRSDAGLIVRTAPMEDQQEGQLFYIPVDALKTEGDQLVLDPDKLASEAPKAEQFNPQDYNAVQESDQLLNELVGGEEVTQR